MEMRLLFRKWGVKRKVAQKADEKAQEAWKRGFLEALRAQRVKDGRKVVFADEMRIGMIGQVQRK